MHSLTTTHWQVVKRILCYLKSTIYHGISLQPSIDLSLTCYIDADWAGCPDDRKSTSDHCCFLGPNLISWSCTKQKVVSRSSAESEYRGLAASELIWIETFLTELHIPFFTPQSSFVIILVPPILLLIPFCMLVRSTLKSIIISFVCSINPYRSNLHLLKSKLQTS